MNETFYHFLFYFLFVNKAKGIPAKYQTHYGGKFAKVLVCWCTCVFQRRLNCHHALLINLFARECMCGSNYDTGLGVGDGRTYVSTYTFYFL